MHYILQGLPKAYCRPLHLSKIVFYLKKCISLPNIKIQKSFTLKYYQIFYRQLAINVHDCNQDQIEKYCINKHE